MNHTIIHKRNFWSKSLLKYETNENIRRNRRNQEKKNNIECNHGLVFQTFSIHILFIFTYKSIDSLIWEAQRMLLFLSCIYIAYYFSTRFCFGRRALQIISIGYGSTFRASL